MSLQLHLLCTVFLVHIFSVLASEESFSIPADEKATVCGLDDFEIDTLAKANYWSVSFMREHLNKCFVPDGYERHQISSCQFHFSVCRAIPEGVCGGHSDSTACQEVVTEDGHRHYYSIGESRESYEFKPNGYPSSDGFFTVRQGHAVSHHRSSSCHGRFKISLKFVCDRDRVWDPYSRDASTHVHVIVITDHCHLEIEFGYSGACQKVASTLAPARSTCLLPPYNLTGLTRYNYWFAEVSNNYCYPSAFDIVKTCTLYFAFCGALPIENIKEIGPGCSGAAVCQTGDMDQGLRYEHFTYSMGQFESSHGFTINRADEVQFNGFQVGFENGISFPDRFCEDVKTLIVLTCDPVADWSNQNLTAITQVVHRHALPCSYMIVLPYPGACLPVFPINAPTMAPATNISCPLPPYNTTRLTSREYWFAQVPDLCSTVGYGSVESCTVYFAFCRQLPAVVDKGLELGHNCTGAAICLSVGVDKKAGHDKDIFYSMGQFRNFSGFSYNDELTGGGFQMDVGNGSKIHKKHTRTCTIKTKIVLTCNPSAVWSSQNLTNIKLLQNGPCEYTFIIPYSGACLPVFPNATVLPSTAHPTMTTPSKINSTHIHPHPTSTFKPPTSSSPHHVTNSTTMHSSTPIRNSTIRTSTALPTSSHHRTINSTSANHPSSTPTGNSTTVTRTSIQVTTHTSSRTSTIPTASPHVVTTNTTPVNPDRRIILGLTAGVVLSAVLAIVLLVMIIIAVRILIKRKHKLKFLKMES